MLLIIEVNFIVMTSRERKQKRNCARQYRTF
jgi:hypothetical protein